ncbi:Uncharacterized protein SAMN02745866_00745 [Alteromonadaceae bacterium Bs31]|nr:Uncharacterized protein SAMN02745866_00745 [Alteromonadaceae bacterium Bs31]
MRFRFFAVVSCLTAVLLLACSQKDAKPVEYQAEVFNPKWEAGEYFPSLDLFFLAGEQGSIIYSKDGENWNNSISPTSHTLHGIARHPASKAMVAVGEKAAILNSTDEGKTWQPAKINAPEGSDLSTVRFNTAIYDPKHNSWLAAGQKNAILRSLDDAKTWELVSYNGNEDTQKEILDFHREANTGDILFAAQSGTTGRSVDGGEQWSIVEHDMQPAGRYIPHLVSFHQFNNVLLAVADSGRILISTDEGRNWQLKKIPTEGYFTGSAYDPIKNVLALSTQMGEIALSSDMGLSWRLVSFPVENWPSDDIPYLSDIYYDKASESFLVVGNSGVIARSSDGGQSWYADIFRPLFNKSVTRVLHNPEKNIYVAAGLGGVIVRSNTLSHPALPLKNWHAVRPGIDLYIRKVIHLPNSDTFVAVGQLGGIWRSQDDGKNWQLIDVDYPVKIQPPHLRDMVYDKKSDTIIAAGPAGSIIRSVDRGATWAAVYQGEFRKGEAFTQLLYDSKNDAYLASEVLYRTVYRSTNTGLTWENYASFDSNDRNLWHGAISEKLNAFILIGKKGGIALSKDRGLNWSMVESKTYNDLYGAYADDKNPFVLAVGEYGIILRSEDAQNWQVVPSDTDSTLRRVFKVPGTRILIAFGQNGTVVRSSDLGLNWSKANTPQGLEEMREALIEESSGALLLVGRKGAILRSMDKGLNWSSINTRSSQHLRSAAINPKTGTMIAVGEGLIRLSSTKQ